MAKEIVVIGCWRILQTSTKVTIDCGLVLKWLLTWIEVLLSLKVQWETSNTVCLTPTQSLSYKTRNSTIPRGSRRICLWNQRAVPTVGTRLESSDTCLTYVVVVHFMFKACFTTSWFCSMIFCVISHALFWLVRFLTLNFRLQCI